MKKLMSVIGVMAILISPSFAQDKSAAPSPEQRPAVMKQKRKHNFEADIPNLTDEQKQKMKVIKEEGKKKLEPMRAEMKDIRNKMAELKTADEPNQKEINLLVDKSASIKAEMEKVRIDGELKFRQILTPEQLQVFDEKMKEQRSLREGSRAGHKEMKRYK